MRVRPPERRTLWGLLNASQGHSRWLDRGVYNDVGGRGIGECYQKFPQLMAASLLRAVDLWTCSQIDGSRHYAGSYGGCMLVSLDIQKELTGEFWTNRYVLDVPSLADAITPANFIVGKERIITIGDITFTSYRISDMVPGTDAYIVVPIGLQGLRVITSQALPLFNVARVDFGVGQGRPSRKYLRGVLGEEDQESYGILVDASITFINTNYAGPVAGLTEYVDVDGQAITTGFCYGRVGMRQLRRGSRRRTEPIIPVA